MSNRPQEQSQWHIERLVAQAVLQTYADYRDCVNM